MRNLAIAATVAMLTMMGGAVAEQSNQTETQRLEALGRIWIYADFFSPYLGTSGVDWDQALTDSIPAVRHARTSEDFREALDKMLAASGEPLARMFDQKTREVPPTSIEPIRVEDGAAVLNCAAAEQALAEGKRNISALLEGLSHQDAPRGTIVDCRSANGGPNLRALLQSLMAARIDTPIPGGAARVRFYDGFPDQTGESRVYSAGMSTIEQPVLTTTQSGTKLGKPMVFLIDQFMHGFASQFGALQAAGRARVVSEIAFAGDAVYLPVANMTMRMTSGLYVYPDGSIGFAPDAIANGKDALRAARAQLDGGPAHEKRPAALPAPRLAPAYPEEEVPSPEMRLLALYRLWGVVEYFFPYKALMDRPFEDALAEFVPIFLAAETREAYETALLRLAARMNDYHAGIYPIRAAILWSRPSIDIRFIEGRPVVTDILDPALQHSFSLGDEIVSVDGKSVAEIDAHLTPLIPHSTPQSLRYIMTAGLLGGPAGSEAAIGLRGADGQVRTVKAPRLKRTPRQLSGPAWKMLDGNVGYIDSTRLTPDAVDPAFDELMNARALIFDLRGYPKGTFQWVSSRLVRGQGEIPGPQFRRAQYLGPPQGALQTWTTFHQVVRARDKPRYSGPVFVMIDERALSQSEHTAMFLEAAANVTFVGEPTNGTDGDIISVALPGGVFARMTGQDVRHPDGSQLQRVGIKPDVPVAPTIAGIRDGRDEVLERTLELARR